MAKAILHMLSTLKHMSPFDVNMALDAGYDAAIPYTNVTLDEVTALVQDAMFSRAPSAALKTGIFFAGRDAVLALDMLEEAKKALLKPFEVSLFADPYGSFTTAGAMVACTEKVLREKKGRELKGSKIVIYGATGVVGYSAAVIAALEGAEVTVVGYSGLERVAKQADEMNKRFNIKVTPADGSTGEMVRELLLEARNRAVLRPRRRAGSLQGRSQRREEPADRRRRERRAAARRRGLRPARQWRGRFRAWRARHRRSRHRQCEIRRGVGPLQADGHLRQAALPRLPPRFRAGASARLILRALRRRLAGARETG